MISYFNHLKLIFSYFFFLRGIVIIAEAASRLPDNFTKRMKRFGFVVKKTRTGNVTDSRKKQEESNVFVILEFLKIRPMLDTKIKLPSLPLKPSVYKKR